MDKSKSKRLIYCTTFCSSLGPWGSVLGTQRLHYREQGMRDLDDSQFVYPPFLGLLEYISQESRSSMATLIVLVHFGYIRKWNGCGNHKRRRAFHRTA